MFPGDSGPGDSRGVVCEKAGAEFSLFHWLFDAVGTVWGQVVFPAGEALAKHQKQFR